MKKILFMLLFLAATQANAQIWRWTPAGIYNSSPQIGQVVKWDGKSFIVANDSIGTGGGGAVGGDLSGTLPNPTVIGLRGRSIASTAPVSGDVYQYNGSNWAPTPLSTGTIGGTATAGRVAVGAGSNILGSDNEFQYDATTNRLAVGLATPTATIDAFGASSADTDLSFRARNSGNADLLRVYNNGSILMGTGGSLYQLSVSGIKNNTCAGFDIGTVASGYPTCFQLKGTASTGGLVAFSGRMSAPGGQVGLFFENTSTSAGSSVGLDLRNAASGGSPQLTLTLDGLRQWGVMADQPNNGNFTIWDGTNRWFSINAAGFVGVGANAPNVGEKMRINGETTANGRFTSRGTGNAYNTNTSPGLLLKNTTATTGREWTMASINTGPLEVYNDSQSEPVWETSTDGSLLISTLVSSATINSKAVLDLQSTTKGFLPPRMTNAQRLAITSPPSGLTITNSTTGGLNYYSGERWIMLSSSLAPTLTINSNAGTGATVTLSGTGDNDLCFTAALTTTGTAFTVGNMFSVVFATPFDAAVKVTVTNNGAQDGHFYATGISATGFTVVGRSDVTSGNKTYTITCKMSQ